MIELNFWHYFLGIVVLLALLIYWMGDSHIKEESSRHEYFEVVEVDSCKYVKYYKGNGNWGLVHKPDCKNH